MPSPTNTAAAGTRPGQRLSTVHQQTSRGAGPTGDPAPQPHTPPDASACNHHRMTQSHTYTTTHQSGPQRAPHTHRPKALQHRHVPLLRSTPPAPGPSDPSAPYAPTPTTPARAPVPKLWQHRAHRPRGAICRPLYKPSRRPNGITTHQPDRQYGRRKRDLAIARPPTRTRARTGTRRAPLFWLTPRGQTRRAASYRQGFHTPRAGHRQPGPPQRWELAAHGHWQATLEASLGRHPRLKAKPESRHNCQAAQPRGRHPPVSHNARSPRWVPRRKRGDHRSREKRHRQQRTYLPGDHPERRYLAGGRASQKTSVRARQPIARRTLRQAEATRYRTLAKLVQDLDDRSRTPSMPPVYPQKTAHEAQAAGHAGAASSTAPAHCRDTGEPGNAAPGLAPPRGPPGAYAKSEAQTTTPDMPKRAANRGKSTGGHNRDKDSFDAFMESCGSNPHTDPTPATPCGHPDPRGDHTGGSALRVSRQAHVQRDYTALGMETEHAAALDDGPATASGAADQAPDEHSAQGSATLVETGTNTTSEHADQPRGTSPSLGWGHLDYARSEGDARDPSAHGEQAAAQDLDLWIDRLSGGEQLALAVSFRWLLTSRSRHFEEGTRTMADITFGHLAAHEPPATMDDPGQWHYVATWLMAHIGPYGPDEMNFLHWLWHQHAALRIRTAVQRHSI